MTVTLSPIGDLLAVEHWSSRTTAALTPTMGPGEMRRALALPLYRLARDAHQRLYRCVGPEMYERSSASMIRVAPIDAEAVFGVPAPGRPDPDALVAVDLPVMKVESVGMIKPKSRSYLVAPVKVRHISRPIMDDIERATMIGLIHFRLQAAGEHDLALKAASADYRDDIVVTADGRSGNMLWWANKASSAGIAVPSPKKYDAVFRDEQSLVFTPRRKQVS